MTRSRIIWQPVCVVSRYDFDWFMNNFHWFIKYLHINVYIFIYKICLEGYFLILRSWSGRCNKNFPHIFANGFLNNILLDFFSLLWLPRKRVSMGFSSVANRSQKWMNQTRSLRAGCQDPFFSIGSRLTAFIHASLSCLYLMRPGKVCKWIGGLHSRESLFFLQLKGFVLCKFLFSID